MSAGSRIVFTRFISGDSPKLRPWVAHLNRVTVSTPTVAVPLVGLESGAVVWQLVSANNREIARSAGVHSTFDEAAESARRAVAISAELDIELVSESTRGTYGWMARVGDSAVMTCARWYPTNRDRTTSILLAIRCLASAELLSGARLINPSLLAPAVDSHEP